MSKSKKDLISEYNSQSMPTMARINYKGRTGRENSEEAKLHTGDPMCYGCCGPKCLASFIIGIVVIIVCCAYVSQKGTCTEICYWPF